MKRVQNSIWNIELDSGQYKRRWWWWFWLFFMDNPNDPKHPMQLAAMWSTKDCDRFRINDTWWIREKGIHKKGNKIEFAGALGAWFYDGSEMIEPIILDKRDFAVENNHDHGSLVSMDDESYAFLGGPGGYQVKLKKKGFDADLHLTSTNDPLSQDKYSQNNFYFGYGFDILKLRRMNLKGFIRNNGENTEVKGTAYFQKVRISAPIIPPWYWGTIHMEDGSYFQYYMLHLGPPMFRRKDSLGSPLDWGERYISKSISFYSKGEETAYEFKDVRISKAFNKIGLPVFRLYGKNGKQKISFTLNSYSRATWYFEQPMLRLIKTLMYYNEYPVTVSGFSFESQGKRKTQKDLGRGVGNSEHAWGCLI
ncbi:MAG: hypothetical protein JSV09_01430 [Thermoplasmata archaeon]|nr:MAG: hypothetical protein JSV09_01430 [Thermoplasmata archaeon]